eukprot:275495_1
MSSPIHIHTRTRTHIHTMHTTRTQPQSTLQHTNMTTAINTSNDTNTNANTTNKESSTITTTSRTTSTYLARNQLFTIGSKIGNLCHVIQTKIPVHDPPVTDSHNNSFWTGEEEEEDIQKERMIVHTAISNLFQELISFCSICDIDLCVAIVKKMGLNNKKYPVELCKGK